jgi:hypothetical protein
MLTRLFKREYNDLQGSILSRKDLSPLVDLFLKAAGLHFRLAAFFDSSSTPRYIDDLMELWRATLAFLDVAFLLDTPSPENAGHILQYGTNYISQMIVAAGFVLLKLLSSFFASQVDFERGRFAPAGNRFCRYDAGFVKHRTQCFALLRSARTVSPRTCGANARNV